MKRCRYIYLGFDNKNSKFYFDQVTNQLYEENKNSTSNSSKIVPYCGAACVMVYVLFKNIRIQTEIVPIEIYIIASSIIGIILAMISTIYANRANEKMFSKCQPYLQTQATDWEKIFSEGQKMIKLLIQIRIGVIVVAIIIAAFIKTQRNPLFLLYNVVIWWLLVFFFTNTNLRKTKRIIKELSQNIHKS